MANWDNGLRRYQAENDRRNELAQPVPGSRQQNEAIIERMRQSRSSSSPTSQPPRHQHRVLGLVLLLVLILSHRLRRGAFWFALGLGTVGLLVAFIAADTDTANLGVQMIIGACFCSVLWASRQLEHG